MMRLPSLTALLLILSVPAVAQEGEWTYRARPEPVDMTYVAAGGLVPAVTFTCEKDSRQIVARFRVAQRLGVRNENGFWVDDVGRPAPWPVSVTLASTAFQTTIPGLAEVDPQGTGSLISVEFSDRAPVTEGFQQTGVITLAALGGVVSPTPAPRRTVQSFLRYCR